MGLTNKQKIDNRISKLRKELFPIFDTFEPRVRDLSKYDFDYIFRAKSSKYSDVEAVEMIVEGYYEEFGKFMSETDTEKDKPVSETDYQHYKNYADKKAAFPELLKKHGSHIGKTLDELGMTRPTYHAWRDKYPDFAEAVDSVFEFVKDDVEEDFRGSTNMIAKIAWANANMSDRGYGNKKEIDLNVRGSEALNLKVDFIEVARVKDE